MKVKDLAEPLIDCPLCNKPFHISSRNTDIGVVYFNCQSKEHDAKVKCVNNVYRYISLVIQPIDSVYHIDVWSEPKRVLLNKTRDDGAVVYNYLLYNQAAEEFELKDFTDSELKMLLVFQ